MAKVEKKAPLLLIFGGATSELKDPRPYTLNPKPHILGFKPYQLNLSKSKALHPRTTTTWWPWPRILASWPRSPLQVTHTISYHTVPHNTIQCIP